MAGNKADENQTIQPKLSKKQKEAMANLEQSISTLRHKLYLLCPNTVKKDKKATDELINLVDVAETTLKHCQTNPQLVNISSIKKAVEQALPALKHYPDNKEAVYNFAIMMAGFLLVLPGILYVGLGALNYKNNNRFWLFEFGPTANLKAHARELQNAVEQFVKPDVEVEPRYCDGVLC